MANDQLNHLYQNLNDIITSIKAVKGSQFADLVLTGHGLLHSLRCWQACTLDNKDALVELCVLHHAQSINMALDMLVISNNLSTEDTEELMKWIAALDKKTGTTYPDLKQ